MKLFLWHDLFIYYIWGVRVTWCGAWGAAPQVAHLAIFRINSLKIMYRTEVMYFPFAPFGTSQQNQGGLEMILTFFFRA